MKESSHPLETAVAVLVLVCGVLTAFFGWISGTETALQPVGPTESIDVPVTVVIDAGHGGEDGGTQSAAGLYEKTVNLEIAHMLNTMLRANGIKTIMTRTEDILLYDRNADYQGKKKMLDLATRRKITEETEHAIFISIHMNAFPESKYYGLQVFYSPNDPSSSTLAEEIRSCNSAYLQRDNTRKCKEATSAIYLLDRLTCPAVLVECGFLSNPEEAARFETTEYRQQMAFVLFCAIMSHISKQTA